VARPRILLALADRARGRSDHAAAAAPGADPGRAPAGGPLAPPPARPRRRARPARAAHLVSRRVLTRGLGGWCAAALIACGGGGGDDIRREIDRQLEENRQSLPNDNATERPIKERSLPEFVRAYRRAGFFAGEPPAQAAKRIEAAYRSEWEEEPRIRTRFDELSLLYYDRDRVWFEDIERDVLEGNDAYVDAFDEWAKISRGAFRPRDVREEWNGERATIRFTLDGREHSVEAAPQGDFLDLCVLLSLNRLLDRRQFALYRPDTALGQSAFVVAVTDRERRTLERMGWTFATPDEMRLAFGYGRLYEEGAPGSCGA
jgi:hypothetical protein